MVLVARGAVLAVVAMETLPATAVVEVEMVASVVVMTLAAAAVAGALAVTKEVESSDAALL